MAGKVSAAVKIGPRQTELREFDLPDVPVLKNCGLAVAVADACAEAREAAAYVTRAPGGGGAVREVIELLLKNQGHWPELLQRYRG